MPALRNARCAEERSNGDPRGATGRYGRCAARSEATSGEGTTITGRSACWSTPCETLPSRSDLRPVRPRVPITIALAPTSSAWARIVAAIEFSRTRVRACAPGRHAARVGRPPRHADAPDPQRTDPASRSRLAHRHARSGPGDDVHEPLPHGENRDGLPFHELRGAIDRRLCVRRTVVGDQDHGVLLPFCGT